MRPPPPLPTHCICYRRWALRRPTAANRCGTLQCVDELVPTGPPTFVMPSFRPEIPRHPRKIPSLIYAPAKWFWCLQRLPGRDRHCWQISRARVVRDFSFFCANICRFFWHVPATRESGIRTGSIVGPILSHWQSILFLGACLVLTVGAPRLCYALAPVLRWIRHTLKWIRCEPCIATYN